MLILTIQNLEEVIQKFLVDTDGTGVDLSGIYSALDNLNDAVSAIGTDLYEHKTNHPTGDVTVPSTGDGESAFKDTEIPTRVWAKDKYLGDDAVEARGWLIGGRFEFEVLITTGGNIPGGSSQNDNPIIYIKPDVQPTAEDIVTILKKRAPGFYFYKIDGLTVGCMAEWRLVDGVLMVRLRMFNPPGMHGKKYLSKWNVFEAGRDPAQMSRGDTIHGSIAFPIK